jgi:hypothetical protein
VFLALDHDASFISASAVASLALNAATAIFVTVYVLVAQRRSLWKSVSLAFTAWLAVTLALGPVQWSAASAFILNAVVFAICVFIVEPFSRVGMPPTTRTLHDFVLPAGPAAVLDPSGQASPAERQPCRTAGARFTAARVLGRGRRRA